MLFPFYYRNAEIVVHAMGIEPQAALRRGAGQPPASIISRRLDHARPRRRQPARNLRLASRGETRLCAAQLWLGGSAWADNVVAQTMASRNDWDVLTIMIRNELSD